MGLGRTVSFCGNLPGTTKFHDLTVKVPIDDEMKQLWLTVNGGVISVCGNRITMQRWDLGEGLCLLEILILLSNGLKSQDSCAMLAPVDSVKCSGFWF